MMRCWRLLLGCILFLHMTVAFPAGLPVIDVGAITQLSNQLMQMRMQYYMLKRIHASQTGTYRRGKLGLDAALRSSYVVPGSWQDIVGRQRRGLYGGKKAKYAQTVDVLKGRKFREPDGMAAKAYETGTDAVVSAMAGGEALFEEIDVHLKNMRKFARRVDTTVNSKDAQDLHNRIAVEQGLLQTAMAKANVLAMHVQIQIAHHQNLAIAANQRYFKLLQ